MSAYEDLIQAMQERAGQKRSQYDQAQMDFAPYEKKMHEANTNRFRGLIPGLIETAYDAHKRKKIQPEYDARLKQALESSRGVEEIEAQIASLQAQYQAEQERAREDEVASRNQGYKLEVEGVKNQGRIDAAKAKPVKPSAPPSLSVTQIPTGDGGTQTVAIDPKTGNIVREYGVTPPIAKPDSKEDAGKDMDVQEALGVLDEAESMLAESSLISGTGPIQGRLTSLTPWSQKFQASADHLFAVAKRIYKTKGEGQFSDADAAALRGMLFSATRDEGVNQQIIESLRRSLASRSPNFQEFVSSVSGGADPQGGDDIDALVKQYLNK